jgi:hypothetical protein
MIQELEAMRRQSGVAGAGLRIWLARKKFVARP